MSEDRVREAAKADKPKPEESTSDGTSEREEEKGAGKRPKPKSPPAGPHSSPDLTNPDATPGAGTLPPAGEDEDPNAGSTG